MLTEYFKSPSLKTVYSTLIKKKPPLIVPHHQHLVPSRGPHDIADHGVSFVVHALCCSGAWFNLYSCPGSPHDKHPNLCPASRPLPFSRWIRVQVQRLVCCPCANGAISASTRRSAACRWSNTFLSLAPGTCLVEPSHNHCSDLLHYKIRSILRQPTGMHPSRSHREAARQA